MTEVLKYTPYFDISAPQKRLFANSQSLLSMILAELSGTAPHLEGALRQTLQRLVVYPTLNPAGRLQEGMLAEQAGFAPEAEGLLNQAMQRVATQHGLTPNRLLEALKEEARGVSPHAESSLTSILQRLGSLALSAHSMQPGMYTRASLALG